MKIIHDDKETEIDVVEMGEKIDDIFHKYMTEKTGITINHDEIYHFIGNFIRENNKEERRKKAEWDRINKKFDEMIEKWQK